MEQKPTPNHVKSVIQQLGKLASETSNTPSEKKGINALLAALSRDNEGPREPIRVGEEFYLNKRCGDNGSFVETTRKFLVQSHAVAVSEFSNSDGDFFVATISAHPMTCQKGHHLYDDNLPANALYQIDWYFEIYQKRRTVSLQGEQKTTLGVRKFYHMLRRQSFKFGEASLDAFDLQPSRVMREVAFTIYSEIKNRIDEVSIGDEISKKRVQRIVDLNIKRIADEIRFNGDEENAKWLYKHEY